MPLYLVVSDMGREPFVSWNMDCIVGLLEAERGETVLIMAVDMWSKWLEVKAIAQLSSVVTAFFLYENIIVRFSVPQYVRCNMGTEF